MDNEVETADNRYKHVYEGAPNVFSRAYEYTIYSPFTDFEIIGAIRNLIHVEIEVYP